MIDALIDFYSGLAIGDVIAGDSAPIHTPMTADRSFRRDSNRYCKNNRRHAASMAALKKASHRKQRRKARQDLDYIPGRVTGHDVI